LVILLGALLVIFGAAIAVLFGPDDEVVSGPHPLSSKGIAIATAPSAIGYAGPTVQVRVISADERRVFVGLAHDVDVKDYLADSAYTRVDMISLPWDTTTSQVAGDDSAARLPAKLDWWLVSETAVGEASMTFTLPDDSVDVVVTNADLRPGVRIEATVTALRSGAFVGGLGMAVFGFGLMVVGRVLTVSPG